MWQKHIYLTAKLDLAKHKDALKESGESPKRLSLPPEQGEVNGSDASASNRLGRRNSERPITEAKMAQQPTKPKTKEAVSPLP